MRTPRRLVVDYDVDRLDVEVRRRMELTSTNEPFGLASQQTIVDRRVECEVPSDNNTPIGAKCGAWSTQVDRFVSVVPVGPLPRS